MRTHFSPSVSLLALLALLTPAGAVAGNEHVPHAPHERPGELGRQTSDTAPGGATINLFSGGLLLHQPIYSAPVNGNVRHALAAVYNSKDQWTHVYSTASVSYGAYWAPNDVHALEQVSLHDGRPDSGGHSELGWGWRLTLGRIGFNGNWTDKYVFTPDGTPHRFYVMGANGTGAPTGDNESKHLITRDGSFLRGTWFRKNPAGPDHYENRIYKVFLPDGTILEYAHFVEDAFSRLHEYIPSVDRHYGGWYLTTQIDVFGNRVDIEYWDRPLCGHVIKKITDSHGREITTALTTSSNDVLDGLIESITYPTSNGSATTYFDYEALEDMTYPPGQSINSRAPGQQVPQSQMTLRVALLKRIRSPESVTTEFEYNAHGEVKVQRLPTGAAIEYVHENYTWLNHWPGVDLIQGRGVGSRTTWLSGTPGTTPDPESTWTYLRDQRHPGCSTGTAHRVHRQDPTGSWRSYEYVRSWWDTRYPGQEHAFPTTDLLKTVIVWDEPFEIWNDAECGVPPTGIERYRVVRNKWESDERLVGFSSGGWWSGDVYADENPRLVHQTTLLDDGTHESEDACLYDGLGGFEFEAVRGDTIFTPRFTRRVREHHLCQWILGEVVEEQVGEDGHANLRWLRYSDDGQLVQDLKSRRTDLPYPPARLSQAELDAAECDNSGQVEDNKRTIATLWVENELLQPGNIVDEVTRVNGAACDPGPPASCSPSGYFWNSPVLNVSGNPAEDFWEQRHQYHPSRSQPPTFGPNAWGNLATTTWSGGSHDPAWAAPSTWQKRFTWAYGAVSAEQWIGAPWYVFDREIDHGTGLTLGEWRSDGTHVTFRHDDMGRLRETTPDETIPHPAGGSAREAGTVVTYWPSQRHVSRIQRSQLAPPEAGRETYETYDKLGRLVTEQRRQADGTLATRSTEWDVLDRKVVVSEWNSTWLVYPEISFPNSTSFTYGTGVTPDPLGRLRKIVAADGATKTIDYAGLTTTERVAGVNGDPNEVAQALVRRDSLGRIKQVHLVDTPASPAADAVYKYDRFDNLVSATTYGPGQTPLDGQLRTWTYNGASLLLEAQDPESGRSAYAYNALGKACRAEDADGRVRFVLYDEAGRQVEEKEAYVDPVTLQPAERKLRAWTYDETTQGPFALGKLTTEFTFDKTFQALETARVYTYAGLSGRLSRVGYTDCAPSVCRVFSAELTHDDLGLVETARYPTQLAADAVLHGYRFGQLVRLGTVSDPDAFVLDAAYVPSGAIGELQLANGVVDTITPDSRNRPRRITAIGGTGTHFDSGEYTYDGPGNLTSLAGSVTGADGRFVYDLVGRLTSADLLSFGEFTYRYDAWGNMTDRSLQPVTGTCLPHEEGLFAGREYFGGPGGTVSSNVTNRVSTLNADCFSGLEISYDESGNVLRDESSSYDFDALHQMTSRTRHATGLRDLFGYDAQGNRAWRSTGSTPSDIKHYLRSPDGKTWSEWAADKKEFIYFNERLCVVQTLDAGGPIREWQHVDHLGSVRAATDDSGQLVATFDYSPFGLESPASGGSDTRAFAGHVREGDGDLDYMMARYYRPDLARFLSPDPVDGAVVAPQSWNRYTYARNNPVLYVDPDGLEDVLVFKTQANPDHDKTNNPWGKAAQWERKQWETKLKGKYDTLNIKILDVKTVAEVNKALKSAKDVAGVSFIGHSNAQALFVGSGDVPGSNISALAGKNNVSPTQLDWSGLKPEASIRILGCRAGSGRDSVAQNVSDASGKPVTAANRAINFNETTGMAFIRRIRGGEWLRVEPRPKRDTKN